MMAGESTLIYFKQSYISAKSYGPNIQFLCFFLIVLRNNLIQERDADFILRMKALLYVYYGFSLSHASCLIVTNKSADLAFEPGTWSIKILCRRWNREWSR